MAAQRPKRTYGYRSAAEIRRVRTVNLLFAFVATVAIGVQIYLITGYFSARSDKNFKSEQYTAAQTRLEESEKKVKDAQSEYDALIADIANLESRLAELSE